MKTFALMQDGAVLELFPEFVQIEGGEPVPLEERFHPDFVAQLVEYDAENPPEQPEPPAAPPPAVVSMAQARCALIEAGKYAQVQQAIAALTGVDGEKARVRWEFAATVERNSPLVDLLASTLGLGSADLDQLFIAASKL